MGKAKAFNLLDKKGKDLSGVIENQMQELQKEIA